MKKLIVILSAIATTITILLTANLVYPTRSEVDAKVRQNRDAVNDIRDDIRDLGFKIDDLKDLFIERFSSK